MRAASPMNSPPGLETVDPEAARAFILEESMAAVSRINRYILQLLHEDRERGGLLTSLVGLDSDNRQALEALLDRPWAEIEALIARLSSPLWSLADRPTCWKTLAQGTNKPEDLVRVDGELCP